MQNVSPDADSATPTSCSAPAPSIFSSSRPSTPIPTFVPSSVGIFTADVGVKKSRENVGRRRDSSVGHRRRLTIDMVCSDQLQLITKYTLLAMLSVVSSVVEILGFIFWIGSGAEEGSSLRDVLQTIIGIALASHILLNVICITFAFKVYLKQYRCLCWCCDWKLQVCCFNMVDRHYQSKTEIQKCELHQQISDRNSTERERTNVEEE